MKPWTTHPAPSGRVLHVVGSWSGQNFRPVCSDLSLWPWHAETGVLTDDLPDAGQPPVCAHCVRKMKRRTQWFADLTEVLEDQSHGNRY